MTRSIDTEANGLSGDAAYERIAARILVAIHNYESACDLRRQARSLEIFGHRGAYIAEEAATDAGRLEVIIGMLRKEGI